MNIFKYNKLNKDLYNTLLILFIKKITLIIN